MSEFEMRDGIWVREQRRAVRQPGIMGSDDILLDIECVKVPVRQQFENWHQSTRFRVVMVGVAEWSALDHETMQLTQWAIQGECGWPDQIPEDALIHEVEHQLGETQGALWFNATRDFDRAVLEGRWVQARRPHSLWPGAWPHFDWSLSRQMRWFNFHWTHPIRPHLVDRAGDCTGKEIADPRTYPGHEAVARHNELDLVEMARSLALESPVR